MAGLVVLLILMFVEFRKVYEFWANLNLAGMGNAGAAYDELGLSSVPLEDITTGIQIGCFFFAASVTMYAFCVADYCLRQEKCCNWLTNEHDGACDCFGHWFCLLLRWLVWLIIWILALVMLILVGVFGA